MLPLLLTLLLTLAGETAPEFVPNRTVVFLSDFGTRGDAVGICKGVMLSHDLGLRIVDLTHRIAPFGIREAGIYLRQALRYYPSGTVFVAVVDPGVGTSRRAIVLETRTGMLIVAPDNGLAPLAATDAGIRGIWELRDPRFMRPDRDVTFAGRDLFAPAAALLASGGARPAEAGPALEAIRTLELPLARAAPGRVEGVVLLIGDPYGNVWTNIERTHLERAFGRAPERIEVTIGAVELELPLVSTFGEVSAGRPLAYFNSHGQLSFAINLGSFAGSHGVEVDGTVEVRGRTDPEAVPPAD